MKKGFTIFIGVLLLLSLSIAAFAGGEKETTEAGKAKEPVQVNAWMIGGRSQVETLEEIFAAFTKENPNITVELTMNGNWEEHLQKTLVATAGGNPPDLIRSKPFWVAEFAHRNAIEDLEPWIAKEKNISIDKDAFWPLRWEHSFYKGKMYSLPWTTFTELFFVNKKLLREAGIDRGPDTRDEYRAFAKKTTDVDKKQWGTMLYTYTRVGPAMTEFWEIPMMQAGGFVMNDDRSKFTFDSPAGREGLQFQVDMIYKDESCLPPEYSSLTQPFERGQIAMRWSGPWLFASLPKNFPDLEWEAILAPKNKNRSVYATGNHLVMFKGGKHKNETWDLLKFMFRPENDHKWNSEGGYIPVRKENFEKEPYKSSPAWQLQKKQFTRDDVRLRPYFLGFTEIQSKTAEWINKAYRNNISVEEALSKAEDEANAMLKKLSQ